MGPPGRTLHRALPQAERNPLTLIRRPPSFDSTRSLVGLDSTNTVRLGVQPCGSVRHRRPPLRSRGATGCDRRRGAVDRDRVVCRIRPSSASLRGARVHPAVKCERRSARWVSRIPFGVQMDTLRRNLACTVGFIYKGSATSYRETTGAPSGLRSCKSKVKVLPGSPVLSPAEVVRYDLPASRWCGSRVP